MRRIRASIAVLAVAGTLLLGAPSHAQDWSSGWAPVYEDYARGFGSNRPYWWSDLGPSPYWGGTSFDEGLGWPYNTWYGPATTYTYRVAPATHLYPPPRGSAVATARSVADESLGIHCSTPVVTCVLRQASVIGGGCSCKSAGGPARGTVTP